MRRCPNPPTPLNTPETGKEWQSYALSRRTIPAVWCVGVSTICGSCVRVVQTAIDPSTCWHLGSHQLSRCYRSLELFGCRQREATYNRIIEQVTNPISTHCGREPDTFSSSFNQSRSSMSCRQYLDYQVPFCSDVPDSPKGSQNRIAIAKVGNRRNRALPSLGRSPD